MTTIDLDECDNQCTYDKDNKDNSIVNNDDQSNCKLTSSCTDEIENDNTLLYNIKQRPPFIFAVFTALQVVEIVILSIIWLPLVTAPSLCIHPDDRAKFGIISLSLFTSGLSTLLFCTFGLRLPVLLLPSVDYVIAMLSVLKSLDIKCPTITDIYLMGDINRTSEWQNRFKYLQGGIIVISILQIVFGFTGISGVFDTLLSKPYVLIPVTIILGLSYSSQILNITSSSTDILSTINGSDSTAFMEQWGNIILTMVLILFIGFKLKNYDVTYPTYANGKGCTTSEIKLFRILPVLLASFFVLVIYPIISTLINGKINSISSSILEDSYGNSKSLLLNLPFPFSWPTYDINAIILFIPAAIKQIIVSIVVFRVTNFIYGTYPNRNYINRGIYLEGFCNLISGVFGFNTLSSPLNIGVMQLTGVGSRFVMQLAGLLLILFSFSSDAIDILVNISPVFLKTVTFILSAIIAVIGLSMLKKINCHTNRCYTIIGVSLFAGVVIPKYMANITSESPFYTILLTFLTSNVVICMCFALFMDYLLPSNRQHIDWETSLSDIKEKEEKKNSFSICEECFAFFL